jgi:hypothetical protein
MTRLIRHSPRNASLTLLARLVGMGAIVFVLGCGGGGNGGSTQVDVPAAGASALAHYALIQPADLPAADWTVTNDDFSQSNLPTPECAKMNALHDATQQALLGRANRRFSSSTKTTLPLVVSQSVQILKGRSDAVAQLEKERSLLKDGNLTSCLEAFVRSLYGFNLISVNVQPTLLGTAPAGGIAYGFDADVAIPTQNPLLPTSPPITVHAEYYVWINGKALIQANVSGPQDAVTRDLVNTALQRIQSATQRAFEGTPAPAATALP